MSLKPPLAKVPIGYLEGSPVALEPEWLRYLTLDFPRAVIPRVYLVADLPTAESASRAFVSDANATTFASVVAGGGANFVPVYADGTSWRIG